MAGGGDISGISLLELGVGLSGEVKMGTLENCSEVWSKSSKNCHFNIKDRFWVLDAYPCQADRFRSTLKAYIPHIYRRGKWADLRLFPKYLALK